MWSLSLRCLSSEEGIDFNKLRLLSTFVSRTRITKKALFLEGLNLSDLDVTGGWLNSFKEWAGFRKAGEGTTQPNEKGNKRPLMHNYQMDRMAEGQKKKIEDAFNYFSLHGWKEIKHEVMRSLSSNLQDHCDFNLSQNPLIRRRYLTTHGLWVSLRQIQERSSNEWLGQLTLEIWAIMERFSMELVLGEAVWREQSIHH